MATRVILPSVSVPVLSVQMMDAEPSVSTAASLRMSTFSLTISEQPEDRAMVTHRGSPSGIAATVRVTATRIMNSQDGVSGSSGSLVSSAMPTAKTPMHTAMAMYPIFRASASRLCCRGELLALVSGRQRSLFFSFFLGSGATPSSLVASPWGACSSSSSLVPLRSAAMEPTRVRIPVATTMPTAAPALTSQLEKAMLSAVSFSAAPGTRGFTLVPLATSSGSPVSSISFTRRSFALSMRMSAGTTSPVPSLTISPRTRSLESTCTSCPSRMALVVGDCSDDSASSASLALFSVTAAMVALMSTMMVMAMESM
mmetsp:Transcript_12110/g.29323  ORF Transcript_12110/g.29323 Transcript_12110/m.29323 type:complete len:313 (+) Transcript_12110:2473-3411(+)